MKYFEKNVMHGADYIVLHRHLTKASAVAANNLFFQEAIDDMESEEHRVILAKCAYTVIGICEAIIDMVPADEREKAFAEGVVRAHQLRRHRKAHQNHPRKALAKPNEPRARAAPTSTREKYG